MADSSTIPPTATQSPPLPPSLMVIDGSERDLSPSHSDYLSRREVLQRRSHRIKQLARLYRDHYWVLMEELKGKYRENYWKFGKSPVMEDEQDIGVDCNGQDIGRCELSGCKAKAMALTNYCHSHILSDSKQRLYKGCTFVIKGMQSGPLLCSKPVLRSMIPSYCPGHIQKGEKCFARDLRKAGLNVSSTNKLHLDLHVLVSEFVR